MGEKTADSDNDDNPLGTVAIIGCEGRVVVGPSRCRRQADARQGVTSRPNYPWSPSDCLLGQNTQCVSLTIITSPEVVNSMKIIQSRFAARPTRTTRFSSTMIGSFVSLGI